MGFSRTLSADARAPCVPCCRAARARDDDLALASADRIAALNDAHAGAGSGGAAAAGDCAQQARALAPVVRRFDRYREALPSARAAMDLNELGDEPGDRPPAQPCLTRLPVVAARLNETLGLPPGTLQDADLRNDDTGFRAALYRDEGTGRLILVPRDTQPHSLVDWQTNLRNGAGLDTPQYKAMRGLTAKLAANDRHFDLAGYSKGGGLAQQAGLVDGRAQVRLFNSAGVPEAMLAWTGRADFDSLAARTRAFSSDGDFLTFMNTAADPGQAIVNARFLQRELAGQAPGVDAIDIRVRNPAMRGVDDPAFAADRQRTLDDFAARIDGMQAAYDAGGAVALPPPVRAASQETVAGSMTWAGRLLGADGGQPGLGKLAQHRMAVVLGALERDVRADRGRLQAFLARCG